MSNGSLIAIDPGNKESAVACFDDDGLFILSKKLPNEELLAAIRHSELLFEKGRRTYRVRAAEHLAVEMIACYGMAVGAEVFDTCVWIGRFIEAWGKPHTRVYRKEVKLHLCGNNRAKDPNIRQAIIDRYGGQEAAIGKKANQGPLYGVVADQWAAIAVGLTFLETRLMTVGPLAGAAAGGVTT